MKILLMYEPSVRHINALRRAAPNADFMSVTSEDEARRMIKRAEIVMGNRFFIQSLPYAECLRWMQSNSIGVDIILRSGLVSSELMLTSAKGVYNDEVADHAVALLLAIYREIPLAYKNQCGKVWHRTALRSLSGQRGLILGWGGVGKAIASRLFAFGMQIDGVRLRHSGAPVRDNEGSVIHGPDSWRNVLAVSDILIAALPLTRKTENLISRSELSALKHGAVVINVGRGGTVDEDALVELLRNGHLSGAALDVFSEEPLDESSPLWDAPGLIITPHLARSPETGAFRWEFLFEENLRRYVTGLPLLNLVNNEEGY